MSRKATLIASLSTIVCAFATGALAQEAFKSSKFLTYPADGQNGYISATVMAAGLVAAQNNKTQARCIDDWGAKFREGGFQPVIEVMHRFPDDHPTSLVLAVLQKACGSFRYVN